MPRSTAVLVVAATAAEGTWADGRAELLVCGVGPVEAAAATARALAARRPSAVLHVGVAGARRRAALPIGAVVVGTESLYTDLSARLDGLERAVRPDARLLAHVAAAVPGCRLVPIATSAAVAGSTAADVEAMEGFGVLRAARLAGVPAVELRVIANAVEEDDRDRWDLPAALRTLAAVGPLALDAARAG